MADFQQSGVITTLHRLADRPVESLEAELLEWSHETPMSLIIPSLHSELGRPALQHIVDELRDVAYLNEVIIGLDSADKEQFDDAKRYFSQLAQPHRILWNDGPNLRAVDDALAARDLAPQAAGKGRNVWYCLGYYLARGSSEIVAMHDADITTYDRSMLARLLYPIAHPTFGYAFCKGYYFRSDGEQLNGRVTRLLVAPLIRALDQTVGDHPYLDYLSSFRYPLAGECSMHSNVVRNIRIPSDWGLEIGLLSEIYRRYTPRRICQVDLADAYDHKHQDVSHDDPNSGLHKMAIDIAKAMYRKLAIEGEVFSSATFRTIKAAYYRSALDFVEQYHSDAVMNGLNLDRHLEEQTVETFAQAVMEAGETFLSDPMETPFIPSWSRVISAAPSTFDDIMAAVEADNA